MKLKKSLVNKEQRITTTELGEYVYQSRKYHLGYADIDQTGKSDLEKGRKEHQALYETYSYLKANPGVSIYAVSGAGFLILGSLLFAIGLGMFLFIGPTLLSLGSIFLIRDYFVIRKANSHRDKLGIGNGKIVYTDLKDEGHVLHSKNLPLSGKPDAIKKIFWRKYVPIEHKSGFAPGYPHPHHKVQLLAACVLVEDNFSGKVPHGILAYPNGSFKVQFTEQDRGIIKNIIERLKADRLLGRAQCNHENLKTCIKCSMESVTSVMWQNENF